MVKKLTVLVSYIYGDLWQPVLLRIGLVYNEVSTIKSIIEFVAIIGIFFGYQGQLPKLAMFGAMVLLVAILAGHILIHLGIPQKKASLNNQLNPQMVEVLERLKRIEEKLST